MRAFAALAVAIFHFTNYYNGQTYLLTNEAVRKPFVYGAQGVEIFYIISGFIIPYSLYHSRYKIIHYFKYMGKRLVRLLPPYITIIGLIQIVSIGLCTYLWGCEHDINFRQIAINIFFVADLFVDYEWINPIFATLKVELQFYVLVGLLFPLFLIKKWWFPVICALLLGLGLLTHGHDTVLVNSPYFIIGMTVFFIKEQGWEPGSIVAFSLTILSLFFFYMWQDVFAALIGFSMLMWLPPKMKFLSFTGKISYSYYLVHGLAGGWFLYNVSWKPFGIDHPVLAIICALVLSWIAAFIIYFTVEKISIKISKKIKY